MLLKNKADTIVFEYLNKFKPIKGKRNKQIRMRLQMWAKITIQNKVEQKAHSNGMRITRVNAKNTSALAFDGSGIIKRSNTNASNCTFSTGKQYNCDLNASYNIGSRYYIREIEKAISVKRWSVIVAKVPQLLEKETSIAKKKIESEIEKAIDSFLDIALSLYENENKEIEEYKDSLIDTKLLAGINKYIELSKSIKNDMQSKIAIF